MLREVVVVVAAAFVGLPGIVAKLGYVLGSKGSYRRNTAMRKITSAGLIPIEASKLHAHKIS